jgi:hypothetical protein
MPIILALRRWKHENQEFKSSLGSTTTPCLKTKEEGIPGKMGLHGQRLGGSKTRDKDVQADRSTTESRLERRIVGKEKCLILEAFRRQTKNLNFSLGNLRNF